MDDERVGGESSDKRGGANRPKTLTLAEFIVDQCPRYMNMGVSYDEYWHGDYTKLPYYRKAYEQRRDEINQQLWLQGLYFLRAIASVMPKAELLYPEEPLPLTKKEVEAQEERQKQVQISNARAYMEAVMKNVNEKRKQKPREVEHDG